MTDWSSPEEIVKDAGVMAKMMLVVYGVYLWEYLISLEFEWDLITGKKKFKWPMIFYFGCRYSIFIAITGILVANNITTEVNCQALYTMVQVTGNMAVGFASILLSLRTIAVWSRSIYVVVPISVIIMGHWALLMYAVQVTAYWDPTELVCVINSIPPSVEGAIFLYSMSFDFTVMCLTGYRLGFAKISGQRSKIVQLIFIDGLIYFLVAFLCNFVASVLAVMNLNPVMSVIGGAPAGTFASIAACRVVRRLTNYATSTTPQGDIMSNLTPGVHSTLNFSNMANGSSNRYPMKKSKINVQMDTFMESQIGAQSFIELDAAGKPRSDIPDPGEQVIVDDFKRPPY